MPTAKLHHSQILTAYVATAIDIADLLIATSSPSRAAPERASVISKIEGYLLPEVRDEVETLIDDLGLEVVSVSRFTEMPESDHLKVREK